MADNPPADEQPDETPQHRRFVADLLQLLTIAHHSLDARGVPRTPHPI